MGRRRAGGALRVGVAAALSALAMPLLHGTPASAVVASDFAPLWRAPSNNVEPGTEAGQLNRPRDAAASPVDGHLFVTDSANARVSEFTAWGEFVKAWGWGVADGSAALQSCGPQAAPPTVGCQHGNPGAGAGQFSSPTGIAIDAAGDVYVLESARVQKFSPAGQFLLTIGEGVLAGPGGNSIAFDPDANAIVVGDAGRIWEFNTDGSLKGEVGFVGPLSGFAGKSVVTLDSDSAGNVYFSVEGLENVHKLGPAPARELLQPSFAVKTPRRGVAVDDAGNVYAIETIGLGFDGIELLGFDSARNPIPGMARGDGFGGPEFSGGFAGDLNGVEFNRCAGSASPGNLFLARDNQFGFSLPLRSYVSAYGSPPIGCGAPPLVPPEIKAQYAVSVSADGALVKAQINPRFWADTTYHVQYGTQACALAGCRNQPTPPGTRLTEKVISAPLTSGGIFLAGLQPDTTYHYRFVAQSSGGGPVFGPDNAFTTFPLEGPPTACPGNERFRTGPSAKLPDCRAYELVSPVDKNNGDIVVARNLSKYRTSLYRTDPSGEKLTYSSFRSFAEPQASPFASQYLAQRDPERGWISEPLAPPRERAILNDIAPSIDNEFKAFSEDLCLAWLRSTYDPPLEPRAVPGYLNVYQRQNCGGGKGAYTALTPISQPPDVDPAAYVRLEFQGASADGADAIFVAPDNLPGSGAPANIARRPQLYKHSAGQVRFVCVLPSGEATVQPCSAGTPEEFGEGRSASLFNAISEDGSRIFWSAWEGSGPGSGSPGKIFVRVEGEDKSRRMSQLVSPEPARFWGAAADGGKALFTIEGGPLARNLYEFNVDEEDPRLIAGGVSGLVGMSEDASRIYFLSTQILSTAKNSEDDVAVVGEPNLYLYQAGSGGGSFTFIGTLTDDDDNHAGEGPSPVNRRPVERTSRVTANGRHAVFMSAASLTGYDNVDVNRDEPALEVYLYDSESNELRCASCNPSGARPTGEELLRAELSHTGVWAAAQIPRPESALYASRVLSEDGTRLVFESHEALVPRDTNGVWDVYEWAALGTGDCGVGKSTFNPESSGCVDLISSGESPRDSTIVDVDVAGDDVFFTTLSSLVPQDYGLVDVYDAKVGGGFPAPEPPKASCQGEACQSPPPPPGDVTPASAAFRGHGNVRPRCRKGKAASRRGKTTRRGKARCKGKKRKPRARGQRRSRR